MKNLELSFTTEPEAAFSHIISQGGMGVNIQDVHNIVLVDIGDGTIDIINTKKTEDNQSKLMWCKIGGSTKVIGGSNIKQVFVEHISKLFPNYNDARYKAQFEEVI